MSFSQLSNPLVEISPIVPATNFVESNIRTIWYRVQTNSTGCYAGSSFDLLAISLPFATVSQLFISCDSYLNSYNGEAKDIGISLDLLSDFPNAGARKLMVKNRVRSSSL